LTLTGIRWAFTTFHAASWHPLTWLSLMLDSELFGLNAGARLLGNALIHSANTFLLFLFLKRLTGATWRSAIVAALFARHRAFYAALPILLLWGCSKWSSMWLNLPSSAMHTETSDKDELFLSSAALRTWRYFAELSTAEHNWLIPDNVQEEPAAIAGRISPTNLGFLLNARQVACEFGFLTVPEFAEQTLRTLATVAKLPRSHGHLLNWYDTRTLQPLKPQFISSVDSGNLVASLWTLQQGCLDLLHRPLLERQLAEPPEEIQPRWKAYIVDGVTPASWCVNI